MRWEDHCFGDQVRAWRHDNRWTQQRLAEALGYDVSYVAKIEQGRRKPSRQFVARLADVLGPTGHLPINWRQPSERVRLPVPATQMVGREDDVGRVCGLLATSARWVTVVGAPGVGKTSLAVEVAWRLAKDLRHGAFFVPLADVRDSESVPVTIAAAVGILQRGSGAPADVAVEALRFRDALIVLDNFEHLLPARPFVERLNRETPHLKLLLTSREALGGRDETEYRLRTLTFPRPGETASRPAEEFPAVELFATRARTLRPSFRLDAVNTDAVVEVCARLDGLPLAITLAASAINLLSPSDIAQSLTHRLELPTGEPAEEGSERSLAAALQWSWNLLRTCERLLLSRLAVFHGGCTLPAAEAVCGDDTYDVLAALTALARKHLVEVASSDDGCSRFTLLESVRRFGLERLAEHGTADVLRRRHCEYFAALTETAAPHLTGGGQQKHWLRTLEVEHRNLVGALEWALAHEPDTALRLGAALWRFFSLRRTGEGRTWLKAALQESHGYSIARVQVLVGAAVLARLQSDLAEADALLDQALDAAERLGATVERALVVLNQGIVDEQRGDYDQAEIRFNEALRISRDLHDERCIGHALNCLGVVALHRGDHDRASPLLLEALRRFRALDDSWSVAVTATNLGWIAETSDLPCEARRWYTECGQLWDAIGDAHGHARSLADLGRVARNEADCESAWRLLRKALDVFQEVGDSRLIAASLLELAAVALRRRQLDLAARLLGAADGVRAALQAAAWPHERKLEDEIVRALSASNDGSALSRARSAGRTLSVGDAVQLAQAGSWPPRANLVR